MACYMDAVTNEWARVAQRNERWKKQVSLKMEAEKALRKVGATVSFDEGNIIIGKES